MTSTKLTVCVLLVLGVTANAVNVACLKEVEALAVQIAELSAAVHTGRAIAAIRQLANLGREYSKVKAACFESQLEDGVGKALFEL
jgi:hypothetical protein